MTWLAGIVLVAQQTTGADMHDQVMLALAGVIAALVTLFGVVLRSQIKEATKHAREANQAVNNVDYGEHRLYDQVRANTAALSRIESAVSRHAEFWDDFHVRWGRLPDDLDDAHDLLTVLGKMQSQIDTIADRLATHDAWERETKWEHDR